MKKLILALVIPATIFLSCQPKEEHSDHHDTDAVETGSISDGIFIHLSKGTEDPHRVLMAFKMAEVMSADKDVLMYLDIEAVHLVVKAAPDVSMEGFTSSLDQIKKLSDAGVIIQACPTCLKVAGYSEEDLMKGVVLADKKKFFNFTQGKILTIDY